MKEFNSASTLYLLLNFNPAYAYALTNVGGVQQKMGLLVEAQKSYEEALEILEELGDEGNLAEVREALSEIEKQQVYSGTIKQLTDKGFGFIVTDETDVFFQYNQLKGVTFDELRIGDSVSFMIEDNPKGTQAINVERDSLSEITNQQNDELQNQATEKKNLEESVTNLYNKQQGLILYYLPTTMQVGETIRCFIRIATIAEMLQKDWEANPVDVQQAIQIADTISMEIKQSAEYEPGEWAFEITRNSLFKQKISRARYTEWIFDVETERVGTYRLMLKITLFEKGKRQSTQMIERQVVVADKPPSPAKKRTQIQKRK